MIIKLVGKSNGIIIIIYGWLCTEVCMTSELIWMTWFW
jgi:hypothetical protein